jgi:Xaa-Pro dipeptidase
VKADVESGAPQMLLNRDRALDVMERHGLDALVATTPENIYYLSGYGTDHSFHFAPQGFGCAILPRDEAIPPTLIVPSWELPSVAEGYSWMPQVRVQYTIDLHVSPDAELDAPEQRLRDLWLAARGGHANRQRVLGSTLNELGLGRAVLGFDDVRVSLELQEQELSGATPREAVNVFREVRVVKTSAEVALLTRANRILQTALEGMAELATAGTTMQEIFRYFRSTMALQGGYGSHGLTSGINRPWISYPSLDYRVKPGDIIYLDPAGHVDFYWADLGRTLVVGSSPSKFEEYYGAIADCHRTVTDLLRPGTSSAELKAAAKESVEGRLPLAGFAPMVHSIGLEQYDHPQPLGDFLNADFVLEEGMVVNFETPYLELGWGILQLEDTYHIRADGPRRVSTLSWDALRS